MARSLFVVALLLNFLQGRADPQYCPTVKVVNDFDFHKYEGIWYEVALQYPFVNVPGRVDTSGCSCSRSVITKTGTQSFDDHFSCLTTDSTSPFELTLKGTIPDLSVPAKMEEIPDKNDVDPYQVIELGENYEYAVVYGCVYVGMASYGDYIRIFHREADAVTKGELDLDGIRSRMRAQGIDPNSLEVVKQSSSCEYPTALATAEYSHSAVLV